jgi:ParB family chromosome partitioning protein
MSDISKTWGATSKGTLLHFDPESLVIVTDKDHPLYDERVEFEINKKDVENVLALGILEPVLVRKNGVREDGTPIVEVVDGRQRVRWAMEANKNLPEGRDKILVPAISKTGADVDLFGMSMTANEIRKQDDPITRAHKIKRFISMGKTQADAAVRTGKSDTTIRNLLALLELAPEVQEGVKQGKFSIQAALKMATLTPQAQAETVAEIKEEIKEKVSSGSSRGTGGKAAKEKIRQKTGGKTKSRDRKVKTTADIKKMLAIVEKKATKSEDAKLATAIFSWYLGNEDALRPYRVLFNAAEEASK